MHYQDRVACALPGHGNSSWPIFRKTHVGRDCSGTTGEWRSYRNISLGFILVTCGVSYPALGSWSSVSCAGTSFDLRTVSADLPGTRGGGDHQSE